MGCASDKELVDELTSEFLAESDEGLDRMERGMAELERRPDDAELLAEIFRAVHTIKGATGFLGLPRLEALAHAGEHLLGLLRDGKLKVSTAIVDGLLRLLDGLRTILRLIEATGGEGNREGDDDVVLIAALRELASGGAVAPGGAVNGGGNGAAAAPSATAAEAVAEREPAETSVRLDVDVLNRMMNLVGELVLTRNQILLSRGDGVGFERMTQRLDCVTADLRETVMRARLQPVGNLFGKFPRVVRSLAQSCGRMVRLECSGQETGLDRSLLETLKDPLMHAVRNAIDHGLEAPEVRAAAGKPREGTLRLRASHQGGHVVVEVEDDGGGVDCDRVKARAVERGLVSAERARTMSEYDALQLIFLPGFSTRTEVTLVSGRGVGLDVVRANVEKIGGTVDLQTRAGQGSTLRMRVPLTLAIVPALVVRSGGQSFALPQSALVELLVVQKRDESSVVTQMGATRLYRLRERLVPMVRLADLFGMPCDERNGYYIAVVESKGQRFGLVVDDLLDPQEIVLKPISAMLRGLGVYAGACLLGNGELALVLDVDGLAARAELRGAESSTEAQAISEDAKDGGGVSMMVYEDVRGERTAVPVDAVERIECVTAAHMQRVAGRWVLPYREEVLTVEGAAAGMESGTETQLRTVIIFAANAMTRRHAVMVRQVLDIAEGEAVRQGAGGEGAMTRVRERLAVLRPGVADELRRAA